MTHPILATVFTSDHSALRPHAYLQGESPSGHCTVCFGGAFAIVHTAEIAPITAVLEHFLLQTAERLQIDPWDARDERNAPINEVLIATEDLYFANR